MKEEVSFLSACLWCHVQYLYTLSGILMESEYYPFLPELSQTFHGRDIGHHVGGVPVAFQRTSSVSSKQALQSLSAVMGLNLAEVAMPLNIKLAFE